VAIFRGVQADIPGLSMNHVAQETDLPVAALPDYPSGQLAAGIPADNVGEARAVVRRLRGLARVCPRPGAQGRAPAGGGRVPPTPLPSSTPSSSPSPSARATATAGGSTAPRLQPPECIEASR
jgi:PPM family protein phosphatase